MKTKETKKKFTKLIKKDKKLLLAPIGVIILVILGYMFLTKSEIVKVSKKNDWSLPNDNMKELPSSTLEINEELDKHDRKKISDANKNYFDELEDINLSTSSDSNKSSRTNKNNFFENLNNSAATPNDTLYENLQHQLKTLDVKERRTVGYVSNDPGAQVNNQEEENTIDIEDFFNNSPVLKKDVEKTSINSNTDVIIYAVIHKDQKVQKNNERVVLRLTKPAIINGVTYKENKILYGFVQFKDQRILINIDNINNTLVSLIAYDTSDGNEGIYSKDANLLGEITKDVVGESLDEIDINGIPVGSSINAIFKKKNKQDPVYLINNYELLLKPKL